MLDKRIKSKVVDAWRTDLICKCGSFMYYTESVRLPNLEGSGHHISHVHKCCKCNKQEHLSEKFPKLDFSYKNSITEPIIHTPNGNERTNRITTNKEPERSS